MIGLYGKYIFKGSTRMWHGKAVEFLGEWESSEQDFLKTYHYDFPNEKLQIFRHKYKPLSKELRRQIEEFMRTDPWFIQIIREEKLDNLLS
jgi:hypothetical protein